MGTFESLSWECYSMMNMAGSQPYHSSQRLGNASYTKLKYFTAKGTSQIDLQISQRKSKNSLKYG